MKIRSLVAAASVGITCLFLVGNAAEAAELKVLSGYGMRDVMKDIGPQFERATGHKLAITIATDRAIVKRIQGGEAFDVVMMGAAIETLAKSGNVEPASTTALARSGIGVAVRRGTAKPDISSPEALKRTLLAAKSIAHVDPADDAPAGIHIAEVLDRLEISNEMKAKTRLVPNPPKGGTVGALVANGEVELGIHPMPLLVNVADIEIVGPLPPDLQSTTVFSGAVVTGAKEVEAGKALINFLRTAEAAAAIKAQGLDPAIP